MIHIVGEAQVWLSREPIKIQPQPVVIVKVTVPGAIRILFKTLLVATLAQAAIFW